MGSAYFAATARRFSCVARWPGLVSACRVVGGPVRELGAGAWSQSRSGQRSTAAPDRWAQSRIRSKQSAVGSTTGVHVGLVLERGLAGDVLVPDAVVEGSELASSSIRPRVRSSCSRVPAGRRRCGPALRAQRRSALAARPATPPVNAGQTRSQVEHVALDDEALRELVASACGPVSWLPRCRCATLRGLRRGRGVAVARATGRR